MTCQDEAEAIYASTQQYVKFSLLTGKIVRITNTLIFKNMNILELEL